MWPCLDGSVCWGCGFVCILNNAQGTHNALSSALGTSTLTLQALVFLPSHNLLDTFIFSITLFKMVQEETALMLNQENWLFLTLDSLAPICLAELQAPSTGSGEIRSLCPHRVKLFEPQKLSEVTSALFSGLFPKAREHSRLPRRLSCTEPGRLEVCWR